MAAGGGKPEGPGFFTNVKPISLTWERDPTVFLQRAIAWCRSQGSRETPDHVIVSERMRRTTMEDRHVLTECAGGWFGGVYDGHGGTRTVEVVAKHLHREFSQACRRGQEPEAAFRHAFARLDRLTARYASGTTATCVFLKGGHLTIAHIGDGRAVLIGPRGAVRQVTTDHRTDTGTERRRILKAGGRVDRGYVVRDGHGLMVTRSFGDRVFRSVGVTAEPDVTTIRLTPRDRFLVVATDGLWDVLSNTEVANLLTSHDWDPATMATRLRKLVAGRHGRDNLAVLGIALA